MTRCVLRSAVAVSVMLAGRSWAADAPQAQGQSADSIVIQFKLFDANDPKIELHPDLTRKPIILLRNLATRTEELFLGDKDSDASVRESKDRKGFYEITLPKGRLINQMFIDVQEANTNPGAIIKVVTANNIVVYPGASNSLEQFGVAAYIAQLSQYASLLNQIEAEFPGRRAEVQAALRARYEGLLRNMERGLDHLLVRPEQQDQMAAATKTLNDVLQLYGLRTPPAPPQQVVICSCRCAEHHVLFGRRRCR